MTNLIPTFIGITLQLLDLMLPKRDFVLSRDSDHSRSIKTQERLRRGLENNLFLMDQQHVNVKILRSL